LSRQLRRTWNGHVKSTDGWRVWPAGRFAFGYSDELGKLKISAEWLMGLPGTHYVIWTRSIPDLPTHRKSLVMQRLADAAEHAHWNLEMDEIEPG